MSETLRRSLLYVPASAEAMVRKAGTRHADVLILDLEDGVPAEAKASAREAIPGYLGSVDFGGSEVLVRVNPPASGWGRADLALLARSATAGVVLPKVEDPETVRAADRALGESVPLFPMVETVAGVVRVGDIARAVPRVAGLLFGAADYRESLRAGRSPEETELIVARTAIAHAARLAGAFAFDSPWFGYRDHAGLEASARRARALGFDGKTAVHPAQVAVINRVFSPTSDELRRARAIVEGLAEARRQGRNVATVDGEMVEPLHLREAERTLERARLAGVEVPQTSP